ncbi:hypothetical protein DKX38_014044 [Salix brachista]|uniref:Small ribosomal subunit protein cS22 n=1 Tax=Salix brachista TaxID=2182728 RepID=A0A5N5LEM4_9ROSI|nr:hypothetical protein DKX38_014044 [Salix brachista]
MTTISSLTTPLPTSTRLALSTNQSKPSFQILKRSNPFNHFPKFTHLHQILNTKAPQRLFAVAEETAPAASADPSSEAARRLYVGNIPRNLTNEELTKIVEEHGAVEKTEVMTVYIGQSKLCTYLLPFEILFLTCIILVMYDKYSGRSRRFAFVTMKTAEDANAAIEKLNGTEIGGREIKVNITEKPLQSLDLSSLQSDESQFVDSPYKVYVGNLAKTVTTDTLKNLFSKKGKVLSAKVSRVPGTSKSSGFGFVTFSSEEDVDVAISSFNNSLLEGQPIRVNKA